MDKMENNICPICGQEASFVDAIEKRAKFINCKHCGRIFIDEDVLSEFKIEGGSKFLAALYFYFTHYKRNNDKTYYVCYNLFDSDEYNQVLVDEIKELIPSTFNEQIEKILLNWSDIISFISDRITFVDLYKKYYSLFFLDYKIDLYLFHSPEQEKPIQEQIRYIVETLCEQNILSKPPTGTERYQIGYRGWEIIGELRKNKILYKQGFVAMWFNEDMEKETAIRSAISRNGFIPIIIKDYQHNNQIVPEILYQIRKSAFVVADLEGNRRGVYFEAGYALGKGKEVIFTVNEYEPLTKEKEPHFDVAQYSQIRYKNKRELEAKLFERIRATIGDGADNKQSRGENV